MSRIKSLPIKRRTDLRGFTLVEMLVSMSVVGVVGLVMFSVMSSTMKLSSVNTATNMSSYRTRQALDRLANSVHYDAIDTPSLINSSGVSAGTATGTTADGILVKTIIRGGYAFFNSDGSTTDDIVPTPSQTEHTFYVQFSASGGGTAPVSHDNFLLVSQTNSDDLEVDTVGSVTTSNGISREKVTTFQDIQETSLSPKYYTVSATRYVKQAYIFVQNGSSNYWTLRHYPTVYTGMDYTNSQNYHALGTGFEKQGTQPWFTLNVDGSTGTTTKWVLLQALVRSSGHGEYSEDISKRNTATTMPLQIKLWSYKTSSGS